MSCVREEKTAPMSRVREDKMAPMSRVREDKMAPPRLRSVEQGDVEQRKK